MAIGLKIILGFICLAGLSFQVFEITSEFFKYKTNTAIETFTIDFIQDPSAHACFRYFDVIDKDQLNKKWKTDYQDLDTNAIAEILEKVTIKELFEWTPSRDDIMSDCKIRVPRSYRMSGLLGYERCKQVFDITKYLHRDSMCYKFHLNDLAHGNKSYEMDKVEFTLNQQGSIFKIYFNSRLLQDSDSLMAFAQVNHSVLLYDSLSIYGKRYYDRKAKTSVNNLIRVHYHTFDKKRLPPPYVTDCFEYPRAESYADMSYSCRNDILAKNFSRVIYSYMIFNESLEAKIIDLELEESDHLKNVLEECYKRIGKYRPACDSLFDVSSPVYVPNPGEERLRLDLMWPTEISFKISHTEALTYIDFFVYIFGAFGTWFGFSFYTHSSLICGHKSSPCHRNHNNQDKSPSGKHSMRIMAKRMAKLEKTVVSLLQQR